MKRQGSVRGRADAGTGSGPGVERVITGAIGDGAGKEGQHVGNKWATNRQQMGDKWVTNGQ